MTHSTTVRAVAFLSIAFAVSWGIVFAGYAFGLHRTMQSAFPVLVGMMAGPAISATICAFLFDKGRRIEALGLRGWPNVWWLLAWLIGLALAAGSVIATILLSDRTLADIGVAALDMARAQLGDNAARLPATPPDPVFLVAASALAGASANGIAVTFTEELGWRGYLHGLWRPARFWTSSLATGVFWGIWHAPAILLYGHNYPDNRELGVLLFVLFCVLLSPVMTLVRDRSGSVFAAGILHGTINALGAVTVLAVTNPVFPWNGLVGIGGFAALAVAVLATAVFVGTPQRRPV